MKTRSKEKGVALLTAIIVLVSILGLSIGLLYMALADNKESVVNRELSIATALAEGATEVAHKQLLVAVANYETPPVGGVADINGNSVAYVITPVGVQRIEVDPQGVQTIIQPYSISADATHNGFTRHVEKIIDVEKTPIFQYVVFYNEDLEILPGPSMTLFGRVHSNHDIYIGSGATLTLQSNYVRSAGKFYRMRKNDGTDSTGTVNIMQYDHSGTYRNMESKTQFAPPSANGFDGEFLGYDANHDGDYLDAGDYKNWTLRAIDQWHGTVQSAEHGVKQVESPQVGNIKMYSPVAGGSGGDYDYDAGSGQYVPVAPGTGGYQKGYFYRNASLSIVNNKAYDVSGNEITVWPDVDGNGTPDNPITQSSIYDGRENKYVTVTNVNLSILGKSGYWPPNGLLYAARTDSSASLPNGVRFTNGNILANPLTIVSPDPVYTQGNYNVGDATHIKQPASVITDSFNILSTKWNNTKTPGSLPKAGETTVNAAFISGSYETTPGTYNGGFENLPRFHENWDGVSCHIRGSFVNIWDSDVGTGTWVYGDDNYTAPGRDWNYDMDFNDFSKLPPFTPSVVGTTRVVWVSR